MNLKKLPNKKVKITHTNGRTFEGVVWDYIYPDDNEPEVEGIILDNLIRDDGRKYQNPVQFNAPDIKSVEVIS